MGSDKVSHHESAHMLGDANQDMYDNDSACHCQDHDHEAGEMQRMGDASNYGG